MELKKHINIRITDEQLKILMTVVENEKTTVSTLIRNIINGYELDRLSRLGKKLKVQ